MLAKFFDRVFLIRPMLLIPVWAYFFLGYNQALRFQGAYPFSVFVRIPVVEKNIHIVYWFGLQPLALLGLFTLLVGGIYVLNQLGDIEADRKNRGLPLLARGIVGRREAAVLAILLLAIPTGVALFFGPLFSALFLCAVALGFAYSLPPLRWSGRPVLDFLSNTAGYGFLTFALGWLAAGNAEWKRLLAHALPYCLLMAGGSIASTIPDMDSDREENKITTAVWLGVRPAAVLGALALAGAVASGWHEQDALAAGIGLFAVVFFLRLILKPQIKNAYAAYQVAGGALVLVAMLLCPPLLLLSAVTLVSTRAYFWKRHGIHYPQMGQ